LLGKADLWPRDVVRMKEPEAHDLQLEVELLQRPIVGSR
jgi:hypothetical protein